MPKKTERIGYDELTQAVRLNDAMAEVGNSINGIADNFNVDLKSLIHVGTQRVLMIENLAASGNVVFTKLLPTTLWMDGFFAAMHLMEQREDPDEK